MGYEEQIADMEALTGLRTAKPRIVLADDHAGVLESASRLLNPDFEVVAAVYDGFDAIDAVDRLDPDVLILDIGIPRLNGIRTARELGRRGGRAKIVFLTVHTDEDYISAALATGACGYVFKSRMHTDLVQAILSALDGSLFVSSRP